MELTKDVFISYSHSDLAAVREIVEALEGEGIRCFFDEEDVVNLFSEKIIAGIKASKAFVVFASKTACVSPDILNEVTAGAKHYAATPNYLFIPYYLEDVSSLTRNLLSYHLDPYSGILAYKDPQSLSKLLKRLRTVCPKEAAPSAVLKPFDNALYGKNAEENIIQLERSRLLVQQRLLLGLDLPILKHILTNKNDATILDIGCGDGSTIMTRVAALKAAGYSIGQVVGIDRDEASIAKARKTYPSQEASFFTIDAEGNDFYLELKNRLASLGISRFDLIHASMILLHLSDPQATLLIARRFLKSDGYFFIRDIDDMLSYAYPDSDDLFAKTIAIEARDEYAGFRQSGRRVLAYLKQLQLKNIRLAASGISTNGLSYDDLDAFFEMALGWIEEDFVELTARFPQDQSKQDDLQFLKAHRRDMIKAFHQPDFIFSLGMMIYLASDLPLDW